MLSLKALNCPSKNWSPPFYPIKLLWKKLFYKIVEMRLPTPLEMHWGDKLYEFYLAKSLKVLFLNILYAIQTKPFLFAWHSTDVKKKRFHTDFTHTFWPDSSEKFRVYLKLCLNICLCFMNWWLHNLHNLDSKCNSLCCKMFLRC